jgi:hypothetical protein
MALNCVVRIPSGSVFLGPQKVSHLAAFDGMLPEFL